MPTTQQLKEAFNMRMKDTSEEQPEEAPVSFWEVFDEFVKECGNQNNWTASTYEKFAAARNHLKEFKEYATFNYFNEFGLNEYVNFLRDTKDMRNSTIGKQMGFLKWFLRWSFKKGHHQNIAYDTFKPYACCKHSHAALYAMQVLRTEHGLKPDDVEAIEILVNEITDFLINNPQPENPYGCKFSIQYCVAGMLKYGDMGVDRFLTEVIGDAEVRSLMAKTKVMRDAAIEAVHAADAAKLASKLIVRCKDGRVLELQVDFPKGDPPNPMSWDESVAKFMSLAAPVYGEEKTAKLCRLIDNLEASADFAADLAECLA